MFTQVLIRRLRDPAAATRHRHRVGASVDARRVAARISRVGQVVLGLLWLTDGVMQFQPYMFDTTFITGVILPNTSGQPGIIRTPIT
jgi:hypothetical protein